MDTSFICDLPSGPLDPHRRNVSFNWKRLKLVFEKPELLKLKLKIWNTLEKDPLFQRFDEEPTTQEQKRIAALQLQQFRKYNFMPIISNKTIVKDRARCLMTINEALAVVYSAVSVKQAIGVYLFQNTLTTLGSERHQYIIEDLWNRHTLSALALTEVAHGSDAKNMRTTATYDKETEEFVINTPDFQAAKCWVGNLGKTCSMVLLFAQLYTGGQCFGLHAFVVPVRDPKTLLPYPGLIIGDIGEKIGLNGIDNGFVMFQNYRIPRQNLLNRIADVTKDGDYESSFTEPGKLLGAALENLSAGRVGIMQESSNNLINAVTIAVRYAALRTQFGSDNGPEVPIIEYQLHQWRLFPYVSAAAVLKIFTTSLADDYLNAVEMSNTDTAIDNLREMISEIHAIISATKPLVTWTCLHAIQECREACGGHGYLKAARFGDLRSTVDPCVSYEGDNNVLLQQTSNWLLRQWSSVINDNGTHSPMKTCSFITNYKKILSTRFVGSSVVHVKTIAFITQTYEWLITYLLKNTHQKQNELLTTQCKFTARNNSQVYKATTLSKAYGEYVALKYYWNHINERVEADLRFVLDTLGLLYGLSCLDKYLVYLLQGNYANGSLVQYVQDAILELCNEMKESAVSVTDALAPPDFVINSVLGKADGKLYDNIQAEFFNNPNAMSRPTWWREIKVDDNPNLKLMSKL